MKPSGTDWDLLIHRHLDGTLSEAELRVFDGRLKSDSRLRRRLAEMAFDQNQLSDLLAESGPVPIVVLPPDAREPVEARPVAPLLRPALPTRRRIPRRLLMGAAAVLLCVTAGVVAWILSAARAPFEVVSGEVRIQDSRIEVTGSAPARLRLPDGSEAILAPSSAAVFRGETGDARQVVELAQGGASFSVVPGKGKFRVDTPVGRVGVLGTRFSVELRKAKKRPLLAVAVTEGRVRVEFGGVSRELGAGESRVFGAEADERKEAKTPLSVVVHGKVLAKGDAHIVLAVDGVVKGDAPSLPGRNLRITAGFVKRENGELENERVPFQFLRKLQIGQELSLDVRQNGEEWTVGKLDREQVDWAQRKEDREKKPRDPGKSPERDNDK
jgi:hypothetical protein